MGFSLIRGLYFCLIFFILINLFATCKKSECIGNAYQLKETWSIVPQKDSISVGDTLYLYSNISSKPFDHSSNLNIDFSDNATIGTPFSIRAVFGLNNLKPAIDSFSYFLLNGKLKPNDLDAAQIKDAEWVEGSGNYRLHFGIIARRKGDYCFTLPDAIAKLKKAKECEDGAGIELTNTNSDNNADLSHPYYGLTYVPGTDSTHIFCIRVK